MFDALWGYLGALQLDSIEKKSFDHVCPGAPMSDSAWAGVAERTTVFARVSPAQNNSFLYDFVRVAIPTDNVDETFTQTPRTWNIGVIRGLPRRRVWCA